MHQGIPQSAERTSAIPSRRQRALAVLDVFEEDALVERAARIGETIRSRMESWHQRWDALGDVRGLGAMLAIELVHDRGTKDPAPELATAIVEAAAERGLLLLKSGIYSNCIRVLVPLVIGDAELDEALGVWKTRSAPFSAEFRPSGHEADTPAMAGY